MTAAQHVPAGSMFERSRATQVVSHPPGREYSALTGSALHCMAGRQQTGWSWAHCCGAAGEGDGCTGGGGLEGGGGCTVGLHAQPADCNVVTWACIAGRSNASGLPSMVGCCGLEMHADAGACGPQTSSASGLGPVLDAHHSMQGAAWQPSSSSISSSGSSAAAAAVAAAGQARRLFTV